MVNNLYSEELNKIAINNPEEFRTAKIIREILQQELEINIPKEEIGFLTMFLSAVDVEESHKENRCNSISSWGFNGIKYCKCG